MNWRRLTGIAFAILAMSILPDAALAGHTQGNGIVNGIFGFLGRAAAISRARDAWASVDVNMRDCVARRTNVQVNTLIENGISPADSRITPYMAACDREVADARARAAQAAAAQAAQAEAERQARIAAKEAAAAQKARQEARHRALISKFGVAGAATVEAGIVKVGMTKDEVVAINGAPPSKDVVPPDDELWHYASGDIAFSKGRVSYVGH